MMMDVDEIKRRVSEAKPGLARRYHLKSIGVFGSYTRGEESGSSDVDILVEFSKTVTLIDLIALENELSEMLGVKADVVTRNALKPRIGRRILDEVVNI